MLTLYENLHKITSHERKTVNFRGVGKRNAELSTPSAKRGFVISRIEVWSKH
jgi:hypothetical protein